MVHKSWSPLLQNDRYHIDVFCHAWNFNTASLNSKGSSEPIQISSNEINDLIGVLRPIRHEVEKSRRFHARSSNQALHNPAHLSQFYGIMAASRLKRYHEMENGFVYDAVIRTRYDLLFETDIISTMDEISPETLYGFDLRFEHEKKSCMVSDLCWISDGLTYGRITDLYLDLPSISKKWFDYDYGPEHVLFHHLKSNQINVKNHPWKIRIIRDPSIEDQTNDA